MSNTARLVGVLLVGICLVFLTYRLWPYERPARPTSPPAETTIAEAAQDFHDRLITIDSHVDIPPEWATKGIDPGVKGRWQVDLPKMREGGLDAAFFIVYVGQGPRTDAGHAEAVAMATQKFAAIRRMTDDLYPEEIGLATTAADVQSLVNNGGLAALIGIENAYVLGGRLEMLEFYRDLGARYIGIVHNGHNDLADSAVPLERLGDEESEHGGLSDFGRAVIREANRLGVMVDVSHASKDSTLQAVKVSRAPVIASHSSVSALAEHPRNLDDRTLKAIARKGGVIQVVAFDTYLQQAPTEKIAAIRNAYKEFGIRGNPKRSFGLTHEQWAAYQVRLEEIYKKWERSDIALLVDHIDHVVQVVGIDHVGIASDFGGGGGVAGWPDAASTRAVTDELVSCGYSEENIAKIWGGNLLRVMRDVERKAKG